MSSFRFHRPGSLEEACKLGEKLQDRARYLAGGTELVPDFRSGRDSAEDLISLKDIPGLDSIQAEEEGLRIGSMATLAQIAHSDDVRQHSPALARAASLMAGEQIRSQATIGGNFCRAVSCADTPPICIVSEAQLQLHSLSGVRTMPAEDFFTGPRQTLLLPGEILHSLFLPNPGKGFGASYQRFTLKQGQALAVAAVAASLLLREGKIARARIALAAVAPTPLLVPDAGRFLEGKPADACHFPKASELAEAAASPICDLRGSEQYRRDLVKILSLRALEEALAIAEGGKDE
ncbi:MAG: FAD binding domain-containing protein [Candidatus Krumholzibacteria bacterium]|nr:FAD binding domain-containing protein [Candidatus Krumholzibacteria bacterium]MDP6668431.1 FAD binding domain-containing protein [Candidatus Krumholzibacteria bacterium]MDP6797252.1 FAD binding domain-containing protein [Candidatus Krumholzibacteria bacterium]MDP7021845.1 FAD binding domain-containing protein [Candidatus Krumholzibacteria bacterium]